MLFHVADWQVIPDFPDYEVHVNGLVRHTEYDEIARAFVGPEAPFLRVHLRKDGVLHEVSVAPLVEKLFPKEDDK